MKTHNTDGVHQIDVTRGRKNTNRAGSRGIDVLDGDGTEVSPVTSLLFRNASVTDGDDGLAIVTLSGITVVGTVTPDGTPVNISTGTDHRAFPGAAWLTNPTDTQHGVGDKFLIVYRHGATHLTAGKIVGEICTITDADAWTFTQGSPFDIEDVANDLRCEDGVSVVDIGGTEYAVVAAREYNGTVNLSPHVLVCDDPASTMTSGSTWTRYNITGGLTGHTQDYTQGRVQKLASGDYLLAGGYVSGGTSTAVSLTVSDITDWSAPTMTTIAAGYTETDIEAMPDGTLFAHLRNVADTFHFSSTSTDDGATWSTPVSLFSATGYPMFRVLASGIGLTVYRTVSPDFDTGYRQTQSGTFDTGWGSETVLDSTATSSTYATALQLDANAVLVVFAVEGSGADPTDSDIYSKVFTDSSVVGTTVTVDLNDLGDVTLNSPVVDDTLRYNGTRWVNDNRRWEPVTTNPGAGPELVWDGDDIVMTWRAY